MRAGSIGIAVMALALLGGGCLGDDGGDIADEITHVGEAQALKDGQRATLVGILLDDGEETRLCAAIMESFPPQCGSPSIEVEGFDLDGMEGIEQAEGVSWSQGEVQINGTVHGGVLHAD